MAFMFVHKWPIYTVGIIKVKMLIHTSGLKRNSVNQSILADFLFARLLARHWCVMAIGMFSTYQFVYVLGGHVSA